MRMRRFVLYTLLLVIFHRTAIAYIADFRNKVEFMLSGTIYVNTDAGLSCLTIERFFVPLRYNLSYHGIRKDS